MMLALIEGAGREGIELPEGVIQDLLAVAEMLKVDLSPWLQD